MQSLDWIAAARQGDLNAFNHLVESHQDAVYNLAYRILGDPVAAEESAQAAFIQAYRELGRFRRGAFQEWLFSILVQICRARLSRNSRGTIHPGAHGRSSQDDPAALAQTCLRALPPDDRLVITLVDLVGMDADQAGTVLGLPSKAIRTRLAQARQQIASSVFQY